MQSSPLLLTACLTFGQVTANAAQIECSALFASPHSQISYRNLHFLREMKLEKIVSEIKSLLPDMVHPPFSITELPFDPKNPKHQSQAFVDYRHNVTLEFGSKVYPYFVHEYGHIIVQASLKRAIPQYAREIESTLEIASISEQANNLESKLSAEVEGSPLHARLKDELRALNEKWTKLKIKEQRESLQMRELSLSFEEIFSDLLASILYHKKSYLQEEVGRIGWRDLRIINKDYKTRIIGDPHHNFQKLAAHIYLNHLSKPEASPSLIMKVLYKLTREELEAGQASGWLKPGGLKLGLRHGNVFFGDRNIDEWADQLIIRFDSLMAETDPVN